MDELKAKNRSDQRRTPPVLGSPDTISNLSTKGLALFSEEMNSENSRLKIVGPAEGKCKMLGN